jgi:hypothetical protein
MFIWLLFYISYAYYFYRRATKRTKYNADLVTWFSHFDYSLPLQSNF